VTTILSPIQDTCQRRQGVQVNTKCIHLYLRVEHCLELVSVYKHPSTCRRIQVARLGYLHPATCIWCKRGIRLQQVASYWTCSFSGLMFILWVTKPSLTLSIHGFRCLPLLLVPAIWNCIRPLLLVAFHFPILFQIPNNAEFCPQRCSALCVNALHCTAVTKPWQWETQLQQLKPNVKQIIQSDKPETAR